MVLKSVNYEWTKMTSLRGCQVKKNKVYASTVELCILGIARWAVVDVLAVSSIVCSCPPLQCIGAAI